MAKNIYYMPKKAINSNCMKNKKKLWQCRTAPRGQGQFQYGNSTGAVPNTRFKNYIFLKIGTKSCLRVLQRNNIITRNRETCSKCMKIYKKEGYSSTAPLSQGQFHDGFAMVVPLGQFFYKICLNLNQQLPDKMAKQILILKMPEIAATA